MYFFLLLIILIFVILKVQFVPGVPYPVIRWTTYSTYRSLKRLYHILIDFLATLIPEFTLAPSLDILPYYPYIRCCDEMNVLKGPIILYGATSSRRTSFSSRHGDSLLLNVEKNRNRYIWSLQNIRGNNISIMC